MEPEVNKIRFFFTKLNNNRYHSKTFHQSGCLFIVPVFKAHLPSIQVLRRSQYHKQPYEKALRHGTNTFSTSDRFHFYYRSAHTLPVKCSLFFALFIPPLPVCYRFKAICFPRTLHRLFGYNCPNSKKIFSCFR